MLKGAKIGHLSGQSLRFFILRGICAVSFTSLRCIFAVVELIILSSFTWLNCFQFESTIRSEAISTELPFHIDFCPGMFLLSFPFQGNLQKRIELNLQEKLLLGRVHQ